jgi:hypothetical protein
MIRTIAAALAAFALVSFSARADDAVAKTDTSSTTTKKDAAGGMTKTEKKTHKKTKKTAKPADTTTAPAAK